uniref:Uncharacterized protein n=1 Tax=mine drainage metagenome TaxID=410659 RepID=E6QSM1_9ZZZZ
MSLPPSEIFDQQESKFWTITSFFVKYLHTIPVLYIINT